MPPKQTKKTEVKTNESEIDLLMKEWADIVKEEVVIDEAKNKIIKRKEEMVTKLWDHLNKNPTDQVLAEKVTEKPKALVSKKSTETEEVEEAPVKKTVKKAAATEEVEEAPATKKAPVKKAAATSVKKATEVVEEPATKKAPVKKAAAKEEKPVEEKPKKVAAPPKGTAKPKASAEVEVKKFEHESSSETDVESLSSVSSESEGSDGGED